MSQSKIAIFLAPFFKISLTAIATLFNKQKPSKELEMAWAWCPGGLTNAKPVSHSPSQTFYVAKRIPFAAIFAALNEFLTI